MEESFLPSFIEFLQNNDTDPWTMRSRSTTRVISRKQSRPSTQVLRNTTKPLQPKISKSCGSTYRIKGTCYNISVNKSPISTSQRYTICFETRILFSLKIAYTFIFNDCLVFLNLFILKKSKPSNFTHKMPFKVHEA